MIKLLLNTNRTGYSTNQCGKTMTVGELIEALQNYDEDTPIYFCNDSGYTYGELNEYDIQEMEE